MHQWDRKKCICAKNRRDNGSQDLVFQGLLWVRPFFSFIYILSWPIHKPSLRVFSYPSGNREESPMESQAGAEGRALIQLCYSHLRYLLVKLVVPSSHACTCSQMHHFHLAMCCCWACLIFYNLGKLTESSSSQEYIDEIVPWCSMARQDQEHIKKYIILHWKWYGLALELKGLILWFSSQWCLPQIPCSIFAHQHL